MFGIGLIVGFVLTGLFMIFAIFWIVKDEIERHATYKQKIEDDKKKLTRDYDWTAENIRVALAEFAEKEKLRGQKRDVAAEQAELAQVN